MVAWHATPHPLQGSTGKLTRDDSLAVACMDPGGSFGDLDSGLSKQELLEWTMPPVGSPILVSEVLDEYKFSRQ